MLRHLPSALTAGPYPHPRGWRCGPGTGGGDSGPALEAGRLEAAWLDSSGRPCASHPPTGRSEICTPSCSMVTPGGQFAKCDSPVPLPACPVWGLLGFCSLLQRHLLCVRENAPG